MKKAPPSGDAFSLMELDLRVPGTGYQKLSCKRSECGLRLLIDGILQFGVFIQHRLIAAERRIVTGIQCRDIHIPPAAVHVDLIPLMVRAVYQDARDTGKVAEEHVAVGIGHAVAGTDGVGSKNGSRRRCGVGPIGQMIAEEECQFHGFLLIAEAADLPDEWRAPVCGIAVAVRVFD